MASANKIIHVCDHRDYSILDDNTDDINYNLITFDNTYITWDSTEETFDND